MSASMAEVLVEHFFDSNMPADIDDVNGDWIAECNCDAKLRGSSFADAEAAFAAHQAEVLAAAGYGPIRAACAVGWDAAVAAMTYEDGTPVQVAENTNPYRKASS